MSFSSQLGDAFLQLCDFFVSLCDLFRTGVGGWWRWRWWSWDTSLKFL